jgi:hypothetical protein
MSVLSKVLKVKFEIYISDGTILRIDNTRQYTYDEQGN